MALIKCPECRKKISDQCGQCPNCGYPIETKDTIVEAQNDENIKKDVITEMEKAPKKERKPINKKMLASIIAVIIILLTLGGILGYKALLPRINATKDFKVAVKFVEQKNSELEKEISESEELIAKKQPVLDKALVTALENAVSSTKAVKITNFKKPKKVEDIISRTEELNKTDYSEAIANLNDNHTALEISAKRYQLVNAPTEAYVIQCLQTIPEITGISAVTEDNDPNGNLNKAGGYTSTVYFSHQSVNQNNVYGDTLIEKGTDAGGSIEVYTCVEDAEKRRDYLAAFDGSILASGTHTVVGTVLVRTSNELTATQQKELEIKIIAALTYLEGIDKKTNEQKIEESNPVEDTQQNQSANKPNSFIPEKITFTGGVCSHLVSFGNGTPPDNKTDFIDGEEVCFTGRFSGFSGEYDVTFIGAFPDGTTTTDKLKVMSNDVIGYGWVDCGIGTGNFKIILDSTGEVLAYYEFTIR